MELPYGPLPSTEREASHAPEGPALAPQDGPADQRLLGLPEPSPETYAAFRDRLDRIAPNLDGPEAEQMMGFMLHEQARAFGLNEVQSRHYAEQVASHAEPATTPDFALELPNSLGVQGPALPSKEGGVNAEAYAKPDFGVTYGPDGPTSVTGGFKVGGEVERGGYGASFEMATRAKVGQREVTEEGFTTYTATGDVSASVGGGIEAPVGGVEGRYAKGFETSYQVRMPEEVAPQTDLRTVNLLNPEAMPVGTRIQMDGSAYAQTDVKAFFRLLAVQTNVKEAEGVSVTFEKIDPDTVRVQAGPTEALSVSDKVGISTPIFEVMAGRADALNGATLRTADFDISTEEGRKAYNDFFRNGELPEQNGNGVAGVAAIQQLDFTSQTGLDAALGGQGLFSLEGPENIGSAVVTSYPDGTGSFRQELRYDENVPLTITGRLDAEGNEQLADRRYTYAVDLGENAWALEAALGGTYDAIGTGGVIQEGSRVTLSFTEGEINELRLLAKEAFANNPRADDVGALTSIYGERDRTTPEFALALARNLGGTDVGLVDKLYAIAEFADSNYPNDRFALEKLPGTVAVLPPE